MKRWRLWWSEKKTYFRFWSNSRRWLDLEFKTQRTKFFTSSSKGDRAMSPQSRIIFEKNILFPHLHPLKMMQNPGYRAKMMRFEILRLSSVFSVQFGTIFGPLPGGWKVTNCKKSRFFLFYKKMQLKDPLSQILVQIFF